MSKGRSLIEEVLSNETACGRLGIVDVESIEQSIVKLREAIEVAA